MDRTKRIRKYIEDGKVVVVHHLMAQAALTVLRDPKTPSGRGGFAQASDIVARFLAAEVTRDITTTGITLQTVLGEAQGHRIEQSAVVLPVLRAGLALQPAFWELLPQARIHHIGLIRDEETAVADWYYPKEHRKILSDDWALPVDPMLASGGSACQALDVIKQFRPRRTRFACVIAAPEGIEAVLSRHPDVQIYTLAIDRGLDAHKYIVPGLGDYGDRYFAT